MQVHLNQHYVRHHPSKQHGYFQQDDQSESPWNTGRSRFLIKLKKETPKQTSPSKSMTKSPLNHA